MIIKIIFDNTQRNSGSKECWCCEVDNYKIGDGLMMKYTCRDPDCNQWMCTSCAVHHQFCQLHKNIATGRSLDKLRDKL